MKDELDLHSDDWEQQLQQALAELPDEPAPASLQRRLRRIPRQQRRSERRPWWQPALGTALVLVPAVLAVLLYQEQRQQQQLEQERAMARQDRALALQYLEKANRQTGMAVINTVDAGVSRPVSDSTSHLLREHLDITQEL